MRKTAYQMQHPCMQDQQALLYLQVYILARYLSISQTYHILTIAFLYGVICRLRGHLYLG